MAAGEPVRFRLFAYGNFMRGESDHALLEGAEFLGEVRTRPGYTLVEVGPMAGLLVGGLGSVAGELYAIVYATLAACDTKRDHPRLYHRDVIELDDGSEAHAYLFHADQVRGKRRVRDGIWRRRFAGRQREDAGPFVSWSRSRYRG
jgi:gamma-glutamylcyclotransferase (GGCT)/AIG2-like uncharacterized protein YtfP